MPNVKDVAVKSETMTHHRPLTESQIIQYQEELSKIMIDLSEKEEELSDIKASFKKDMKPLHDRKEEIIETLKDRQVSIKEEVYFVPDYDADQMIGLLASGEEVFRRKLRPEEKQMLLNILPIAK